MTNLRAIKFTFAMGSDDMVLDGFTDDTYWNGFINVWVTKETHEKLDEIWGPMELEIEPNEYGLIEYGGGAVICEEFFRDDVNDIVMETAMVSRDDPTHPHPNYKKVPAK